jgi:hypothetical protein
MDLVCGSIFVLAILTTRCSICYPGSIKVKTFRSHFWLENCDHLIELGVPVKVCLSFTGEIMPTSRVLKKWSETVQKCLKLFCLKLFCLKLYENVWN